MTVRGAKNSVHLYACAEVHKRRVTSVEVNGRECAILRGEFGDENPDFHQLCILKALTFILCFLDHSASSQAVRPCHSLAQAYRCSIWERFEKWLISTTEPTLGNSRIGNTRTHATGSWYCLRSFGRQSAGICVAINFVVDESAGKLLTQAEPRTAVVKCPYGASARVTLRADCTANLHSTPRG